MKVTQGILDYLDQDEYIVEKTLRKHVSDIEKEFEQLEASLQDCKDAKSEFIRAFKSLETELQSYKDGVIAEFIHKTDDVEGHTGMTFTTKECKYDKAYRVTIQEVKG